MTIKIIIACIIVGALCALLVHGLLWAGELIISVIERWRDENS